MPEPTMGISIETTDRKAEAPTMDAHVVFAREKTFDKFQLASYSKGAPASGREVPHIVSAIRC
jgi:hypothetical protein